MNNSIEFGRAVSEPEKEQGVKQRVAEVLEVCSSGKVIDMNERGVESAATKSVLVSLPPYFTASSVKGAVEYVDTHSVEASATERDSASADLLASEVYAYTQEQLTNLFSNRPLSDASEQRSGLEQRVQEWQQELTPAGRVSLVRHWHERGVFPQDDMLDMALGITKTLPALSCRTAQDWERYAERHVFYPSTPYAYIRKVVQDADASGYGSMLDAGSGVGRLLLYGGCVSKIKFSGLETNSGLVQQVTKNAAALGVHVSVEHGDAQRVDASAFDAVYLYNSFEGPDEQAVKRQTADFAVQLLNSGSAGLAVYGFGFSNTEIERFAAFEEDQSFTPENTLVNPLHHAAVVREKAFRLRKFIVSPKKGE